jgi:hypothetical protein
MTTDYSAKWLAFLKKLLPKLHRVAVLSNPDNPSIVKEIEQLQASARALGIDLSVLSAKPRDFEASVAAIAGGGYEALVVTTDPFLEQYTARIIAFAAESRLPAIYPFSTARGARRVDLVFGRPFRDVATCSRLYRSYSEGRATGRPAYRAAYGRKSEDQSKDGKSAGPQCAGFAYRFRRRGDRIGAHIADNSCRL